jgi:hypothetical protein
MFHHPHFSFPLQQMVLIALSLEPSAFSLEQALRA